MQKGLKVRQVYEISRSFFRDVKEIQESIKHSDPSKHPDGCACPEHKLQYTSARRGSDPEVAREKKISY